MRRLTFLLLLACLIAGLRDAKGVLMRPLEINELSAKADLIVEGTVLSKTTLRDDAGRIYTKIVVRVSETWKGQLPTNSTPATLTIVQGGGTLGDVREEVSGGAEYEIGEEFVAFLVLNQRAEPVTIGLAQGKFHVWHDRQTGEKFANNLFHGESEQPADPGKTRTRLQLGELKQQVQQTRP